jgi:ERCC4-type nuclease
VRRHYTDKEITDKLKSLCVLSDTREQVNGHVLGYFDANGIPHTPRKLDTGDYSAMIGDYTLEQDVTIERKASIDEIAGNFTVDRTRLEDEFTRAKADGIKVFLVIENCTWGDIFSHNYISKLLPKSLLATLFSWQIRFNLTIVFCKPEETGRIIYGILSYAAREALKRGEA